MPKVSQGGTHWRPKIRVCVRVCARARAFVACVSVICVCVCDLCHVCVWSMDVCARAWLGEEKGQSCHLSLGLNQHTPNPDSRYPIPTQPCLLNYHALLWIQQSRFIRVSSRPKDKGWRSTPALLPPPPPPPSSTAPPAPVTACASQLNDSNYNNNNDNNNNSTVLQHQPYGPRRFTVKNNIGYICVSIWWWCRASCPRMSVDILGTNCDQCRSTVHCCFTSIETVRLIRTESPGRPPRLSHSSEL